MQISWKTWLLLALSVGSLRCSLPFSTASAGWRIRYDREAVRAREQFLASPPLPAAAGAPPPNIVLIVVDDLDRFDVSAYGSAMRTPHIDALAAGGVRFADAYVTSPICSPSRAGILTGRHQARFGFETQPMEYYPNNLAMYWLGKNAMRTGNWVVTAPPRFPAAWEQAKQGLPPSEITLAELLRRQGYRTAAIGKWHLGHAPQHLPTQRGFDYHYGFHGAFSWYTPRRGTPGYRHFVPPILSSRHQWRQGRKGTGAIRRNGRRVRERDYLTFALRDEALRWIDGGDRRQPFFLYLAFSAPHEPFQAPQAYYDRFAHVADEGKRIYAAMIAALDDAIGDLDRGLRERGLADNTLVFFISDNGGASYTQVAENGPCRGGKLTMFEGGVNVPFLARWPGVLPAGMVCESPVSALDIFATAAGAAGGALPADRPYDGVDLRPLVRGETPAPRRAFYWKADHIEAMRRGEWKFIRSTRDGWTRLYHLGEDRYEARDRETDRQDVLDDLLRDYRRWEEQLPPPLWPRLMDHLFIIDGQRYLFPA